MYKTENLRREFLQKKGLIYMNKLIMAMAAAIVGTLALTAYSDGVQSDLQSNLIRLHIIANSDSEEDQSIKLTIRDAVLKEEGENLASQNERECIRIRQWIIV